ncbi:MAG: integrase arm-type DNA-binding domain-containing protein, partial [Pseudomonadota bacterium]|nr:integrase arm-type DNA-binding domain-containing protein [Pseudomonadota bacterium]
MALTDTAVRNAKPRDRAYKLTDGHGLYLLVQPTGAKYWRLKYRVGRKQMALALGVYPDVSIAEVRERRREARKLLSNGQDPAEVKRENKRQRKSQSENSFENIAREWHENQKGRWTTSHAYCVLRSLESEVFPIIGAKPIHEISAPVILEVVQRIEKRNALDTASRVLQRVSSIYRYAISTGRTTYNPAGDLVGALKTRKVQHRAALMRPELPEFLARLQAYDGRPETRQALQLVVLTFVRSHELRGAKWDEFDFDRAEWRIPASRMKITAEHIVPLSRQAIAILEALKPLTGRYDLVFPNQNNLTRPMSENTLLYALYRMGYHQRATVHGFRATASTILNEMGFRADVIERQLAHAERNKVRAPYHRSEYLEDRRKMMQV